MNGFGRIAAAFSLMALGKLAAADEPRIFIPWSPLNESELAAERAKMWRTPGLSNSFIEKELKEEGRYHTYRDADIFKAFPEVRGHEKFSACTNSMMQGAAEFVFLTDRHQNDVTFETIRCGRADKGLKCWPLKRETRYFLDGSDHYFTLEGVTFPKAKELIEAYTAGRVSRLPGEMIHKPTNISYVKAMPDGQYLMIFGDYLCAGCVTRFTVQPETVDGETRLVAIGEPDTGCI